MITNEMQPGDYRSAIWEFVQNARFPELAVLEVIGNELSIFVWELLGGDNKPRTRMLLPEISSLKVLGQLRSDRIKTPVIILTANSAVQEIVDDLPSGTDHYLVKPFEFSELKARGLLSKIFHATLARVSMTDVG